MYTMLVKYEGQAGKYPVQYKPATGYYVDEKRYHDHDNLGTVVTKEKAAELLVQFLTPDVEKIEIFSV